MAGDQSYNKTKILEDKVERVKYYRRHLIQYILLVVVFIFSVFLISQVSNAAWKMIVITVDSIFYLVFGLWHHVEENNLTSKIVIEYLIISAIIFVALYSIFL